MKEISLETKKLTEKYEKWHKLMQPKDSSTIHVDEIASKVAAFYEKIRGIIDWKEEHLLKRGAIERSLKRRVFSNLDVINGSFSEGKVNAESLILELIRGGHFPNDTIEESKIKEVQKVIDKYIFFLHKSPVIKKKPRLQFYNWVFSISACEIEEILTPSIKERSLIDYMFNSMREKIFLNEGVIVLGGLSEEEKNIQIYIAVQRALFDLDSAVISYHLLKYYYSDWNNPKEETLREISQNIYSLREKTEKDLNLSLGDKFYKICDKYNTAYLILGDIVGSDPLNVKKEIINPENLENLVKKFYKKRLNTLKSRIARAAFYSTLSIFLTNIFALIAIEIPLSKIVGNFNNFAIAIDVLVPTALMALLVVTIKPPPKENIDKVVSEVMKIVYETDKKDSYEIKIQKRKSEFFNILLSFIYSVIFFFILGLIILGLYKINFPPFSYFIFIIFLSLIAFAGAKIRQKSKELHIIEEKEAFISIILEPFSIPIIQLGKWLTLRWKKYNIISVFFSALIDMPFMIFIEFLEQWRYFIKEKKEEIH